MAYTAHQDPEQVKERYDSPQELERKITVLAELIRKSKHFVAFTGAGISTSAGIPDFRGPQGKWTREAQGKQPLQGVATVSAFPTTTHMSLVELQRQGKLKYLISQNCDGLHRRSNFPASALSELHGNGNMEICEDCGEHYFRDLSAHRIGMSRDHFTGRFCSRSGCEGALLEYTIDFGQLLPEGPLHLAEQNARKADLHLVLGSSLTVSPACDLPKSTAQNKGALVIVNLQRTPLDKLATLKIHAKTDTVMQMLMEKLTLDIPRFRLMRRVICGVSSKGQSPPALSRLQLPLGDQTLFIKAVDVHDPSLELDLIRTVDWSASKGKVDLSSMSCSLGWVGHYEEPDIKLVLDLKKSKRQDILLSYDPHSHEWEVLSQESLARDPEPSKLVKAQQKQGLSYARAHRSYCIDGVAKANPSASAAKCEEFCDREFARVRATVRQVRPGIRTAAAADHKVDEKSSGMGHTEQEAMARSSTVKHPDAATSAKNIFECFNSRPPKVIIEKTRTAGESIQCDARMPQSVLVSQCEGTTIILSNKVALLTLHECVNVTVKFAGSIAGLEMIKCQDCTIHSATHCGLFTLENSTRSKLFFAARTGGVKFVSAGISDVTLLAQDGKDDDSTACKTTRLHTDAASKDDSHSPSQFVTRWDAATQEFSASAKLQRQGPAGYIIDNV